jgi:hypothetical protein
MINKILEVSNATLDSINLEPYRPFTKSYGVPKEWFYGLSGQEHYRLLIYIGQLYSNETLLDVGTYQGSSAIALGLSGQNKVISYDLLAQPEIAYIQQENIEFRLEDLTKCDKDIVLSSPFIALDTDHDGTFEHIFYDYLKSIEYKGLLLLDDIKLNDPMKNFWNQITEEKHDISHIGHWSGTGIVKFQ